MRKGQPDRMPCGSTVRTNSLFYCILQASVSLQLLEQSNQAQNHQFKRHRDLFQDPSIIPYMICVYKNNLPIREWCICKRVGPVYSIVQLLTRSVVIRPENQISNFIFHHQKTRGEPYVSYFVGCGGSLLLVSGCSEGTLSGRRVKTLTQHRRCPVVGASSCLCAAQVYYF